MFTHLNEFNKFNKFCENVEKSCIYTLKEISVLEKIFFRFNRLE